MTTPPLLALGQINNYTLHTVLYTGQQLDQHRDDTTTFKLDRIKLLQLSWTVTPHCEWRVLTTTLGTLGLHFIFEVSRF
jgi:hypothetical protein